MLLTLIMTPPPPSSTLFPYTTLFRSEDESFPGLLILRLEGRVFFANAERIGQKIRPLIEEAKPKVVILDLSAVFDRSEEHTSELQSLRHLVCRLLLEKKKNTNNIRDV